jgi:hypothetical protein
MHVRAIPLACGLLALVAATAFAQGGLTWRLQVYAVGANPLTASPTYTLTLPTAIVRCGADQTLPSTPTTSPTNPRTLWWTQPELPGMVCRGDLSRQTTFLGLPTGGPYPFALVATNSNGDATPTAGRDPFTVRARPLAVGILIIRKPQQP